MGKVCREGGRERRQGGKHRERLRCRKSQRWRGRVSSMGSHWAYQGCIASHLTLLPQTVAIRADGDMFPPHLLFPALSTQRSAHLAFLSSLKEDLRNKGIFSSPGPKVRHLCVSVSVLANVMAHPREACCLLLAVCYSRHIRWNLQIFQ